MKWYGCFILVIAKVLLDGFVTNMTFQQQFIIICIKIVMRLQIAENLYILNMHHKRVCRCQLRVMNHIKNNCKVTVIQRIIKKRRNMLQNTISFIITQKDKIFSFLIHFLCKFFKYLSIYINCNIQPVVLSIIVLCVQQNLINVSSVFSANYFSSILIFYLNIK